MGCGPSAHASRSGSVKPDPAPPALVRQHTRAPSKKKIDKGFGRRLSLSGGPAGAKTGTAADDARRRRLSVATAPAEDARTIVKENKTLLDLIGDEDPNVPVVHSGNAVSLPIQWGEYSRPGNDPMKRVKENQDSCLVIDSFGGKPNQMFIGMFDGHGPNGAAASQFCKNRMPETWLQPDLETDPFVCINRGCIQTNQDLHLSNIDVYVSGSTAVCSLLRDNHLVVANVGDSRAVLGRANPSGAIRALDLSNDQKPDRKDELARITQCGGRVFEWGVPRVWLKDVDMPGLAMSRSMGDIAAETVGVYAEPELSEVTLGKNDKFVIWATDGVWEFISSQEAVDIVSQYLERSPIEACNALVKESTRRWGEEEDVVDDTTCVIFFLNYT